MVNFKTLLHDRGSNHGGKSKLKSEQSDDWGKNLYSYRKMETGDFRSRKDTAFHNGSTTNEGAATITAFDAGKAHNTSHAGKAYNAETAHNAETAYHAVSDSEADLSF